MLKGQGWVSIWADLRYSGIQRRSEYILTVRVDYLLFLGVNLEILVKIFNPDWATPSGDYDLISHRRSRRDIDLFSY